MPIWLRKYTYSKLITYYEKQSESRNTSKEPQSKKPARPDISPTYSSKATKI